MNRKQHYVPQSLLRKFTTSLDKDQVYWYRKEKTILSSIKDVFSERDYYDRKESEYFADDVISDGEKAIVDKLLPNLVEMEGLLNQQDSKQACDFISHFALRRSLNRNLLFTIAEEYRLEDDALSLDKISNFEPVPLRLLPPKMLQHKYFLRIYSIPFVMSSGINFLKEILAIHLEKTHVSSKSQSKDIHNKIIIDDNNHQLISESLGDFKWIVLKSQHHLILGDTVCFFEHQDGRFSPFDDGLIKNVYMPISSHKLLVGFKGDYSPKVSFEQINYQNARCCHRSFICAKNSDEIYSLVNLIEGNLKPVQQKVFRDNNSLTKRHIFSQFAAHFTADTDAKMLDDLRVKMK